MTQRRIIEPTAERRVPDGGAVSSGPSTSGARPSSRPTRPAPAVDLPGTATSAPLRSRERISLRRFRDRWFGPLVSSDPWYDQADRRLDELDGRADPVPGGRPRLRVVDRDETGSTVLRLFSAGAIGFLLGFGWSDLLR